MVGAVGGVGPSVGPIATGPSVNPAGPAQNVGTNKHQNNLQSVTSISQSSSIQDSVNISVEGMLLLKAEQSLVAIIIALSDDDKKESDLIIIASMTSQSLQLLAANSPLINISVGSGGETMYSLSGSSSQALSNIQSGNFSSVVSGGISFMSGLVA